MKKPRLLVFACPVEALVKAREIGIEIVNFDLAERVTAARRNAVEELHIINWMIPSSYLPLAQRLHRDHPFDGVVSFGEDNVYASALVGEVLGIKSNSIKSVIVAKDKALMRQVLEASGVAATAFESIGSRPESVAMKAEELAHRLQLPLILKPQDGSGSANVRRCETVEEIAHYLENFFNVSKNGSACIAEEYLDGPEISVETLSFDGHHGVLAITEKQTTGNPSYIETGRFVPAQLKELNHFEGEVKKMVIQTLNAIGHRLGPGHTELKLTKKGPRVIETHTRPGGDGITTLVNLVTGVDVFLETFRFLAFGEFTLNASKARSSVASSQFLLSRGGICPIQNGNEVLKQHPNVFEHALKNPGDHLPASVDSHTRAGHFILGGSTRPQIDEQIHEIRRTLKTLFQDVLV